MEDVAVAAAADVDAEAEDVRRSLTTCAWQVASRQCPAQCFQWHAEAGRYPSLMGAHR
jgi:hypothetical protein